MVSGKIQASGSEPLYIGWFDNFKGIIDEVRICPKALSKEQIYQDYLDMKGGLSSSSTIVPQETAVGDVWKCKVIPNDGYQNGAAKFSNSITIVGSLALATEAAAPPSFTSHTSDNLTNNCCSCDLRLEPCSFYERNWSVLCTKPDTRFSRDQDKIYRETANTYLYSCCACGRKHLLHIKINDTRKLSSSIEGT